MAEEQVPPVPAALTPVGKPLSLIPVVLKEAALDSPTFRATALHFGEQIDIIERWLENYVKTAGKLVQEVTNLESTVNAFLAHAEPPQSVSEAVIDHDYTLLTVRRYNEGAREFWQSTIKGMKRTDFTILEPLRAFLQTDLRALKDLRRTLDSTQKTFDGLIARYAGRKKSEEASSLREEAFQLHEARKAYIKAAMDYCIMAPQIRTSLDKLLVRVFSERWKELKVLREATDKVYTQFSTEMERVRGWSREMENSERVFKRELHLARKQLEDSAESSVRPSRELDDYAISTVPYIGSHGSNQSPANPGPEKSEKQGWLFERTITGKPARTVWTRRWFFLRNGIFGWLIHGTRSGAVEESEKVGVLLCGVRPAFQEERRFCFEVKTKDKTNMLQADSQSELMDWIATFEVAKRKALEDPASTEATATTTVDAAFAISPPVAPEFAARSVDGHNPHGSDELNAVKHADTLPVSSDMDRANLASRGSFDVSGRRNFSGDREGESSGRDHAARIIQKLDLHRRTTANPQLSSMPSSPSPATGIAGLISSSHNIHNFLPVPPQSSSPMLSADGRAATIPFSSLAPSTLANPPAPTNLSKTAVIVRGERGIGVSRRDGSMPSGLLANLWGSTNWGYMNRFERGEIKPIPAPLVSGAPVSQPPSPIHRAVTTADFSDSVSDITSKETPTLDPLHGPAPKHKKTLSAGLSPEPSAAKPEVPRITTSAEEYPSWYPLALKAQDAQFRLLFPNVPLDEKVVLVFKAMWNPNEQQEFPGRVYVTTANVYFYSNHLGLVLVTGVSLSTVDEVTGAPGRDCDFLFIHLKEGDYSRVTVKVFLEPLKLLQRRLNFLVRNCNADVPENPENAIHTLLKMEGLGPESPSADGWDNFNNIDTPIEGPQLHDSKAGLRIDGDLFTNTTSLTRKPTRFKLPLQPVVYRPGGMTQVAMEREFDVSAKALFHVMFGDKSAVFQMLFRERWPQAIIQTPWVQQNGAGLHRREFEYRATAESPVLVRDYQVIEVSNDHLCYVVSDKKTPWYLPNSQDFTLVSKFVITHVAKSRCKLAVYSKIEWSSTPLFITGMLERQALEDLDLEAQDLIDVIADQVNRLGRASRTRKAVQIFGYIGQQNQMLQVAEMPPPTKERIFKLQKRTLGDMFQDVGRALVAGWISTVIAAMTGVLTGIGNILTAHTMLLALLVFSGGMNMLWSYRDTWSWWQERNAGKFMTRMGVHPDIVMSKAVYLRDIDDIFVNETLAADFGIGLSAPLHYSSSSSDDDNAAPGGALQNSCQHTFLNLLSNPEGSASSFFPQHASAFAQHVTPSTRATGSRLHRTRQNLAAYRHDLLVSMRLVNRVEREVLRAEWENWVLDENVRCRRVGEMIKARNETEGGVDAVMEWHEAYCGDCGRALEGLDGLGLR